MLCMMSYSFMKARVLFCMRSFDKLFTATYARTSQEGETYVTRLVRLGHAVLAWLLLAISYICASTEMKNYYLMPILLLVRPNALLNDAEFTGAELF